MQRPHRRGPAGTSRVGDSGGGLPPRSAAPVTIETARVDDLETLYSIEKRCFTSEAFSKKMMASLLRSPESTSLLAKVGEQVVGFIIAVTSEVKRDGVTHVLTLDVVPDARRQGVGRQLLRELESRVAENGAAACLLEVDVENLPARRLYRRMGYKEVGFTKSYYRSGSDCLTMKKNLQLQVLRETEGKGF
jgi:ribosomal-protein-alanine N-acetyltransferase